GAPEAEDANLVRGLLPCDAPAAELERVLPHARVRLLVRREEGADEVVRIVEEAVATTPEDDPPAHLRQHEHRQERPDGEENCSAALDGAALCGGGQDVKTPNPSPPSAARGLANDREGGEALP